MWPFRPRTLTEVLTSAEIEALLGLGADPGSAVALIERSVEGGCESVAATRHREEERPDPFCTFLRHGRAGDAIAFAGADRACAQCEEKFVRRVLEENASAGGEVGERRCHMGLTDFAAIVEVGGSPTGCVVAGRCVTSDDDRQRIRKIAGKLGKLTRAETAAGVSEAPIRPRDDRVRERLVGEIAEIPVASPALRERLGRVAARLGGIATRQYDATRLRRERLILSRAEAWPAEAPRSFGYVARSLAALLEVLRGELAVEFIALFARDPGGLAEREADALPALVAEAGLGVGTARRWLELDPSRLPPAGDGERGVVTRGRDAVSSTITSVRTLDAAASETKDRLTKSVFFAPVELRAGLEAAVAFGPPASAVSPVEDDFLFLAQLAQGVVRRYYTALLELDRGRVRDDADRLRETTDDLQSRISDYRAEKKLARETRGFSRFDGVKLVLASIERVRAELAERRVEVDSRGLPDRCMLHAHRALLGEALEHMLRLGAEQSSGETAEQKPAPLLVFLRERADGASVRLGVEAIGAYVNAAARRALLGLPQEGPVGRSSAPPRADSRTATAPGEETAVAAEGSSPPERRHEVTRLHAIARRHHGRFHLRSDRLRRYESDPRRWLGKLTVHLDLPAEFVTVSATATAAEKQTGARPGRRRSRRGGSSARGPRHSEGSGPPAKPAASPSTADAPSATRQQDTD